jgi:16S rRNA (cytosine1402-N4)-methyltransferase
MNGADHSPGHVPVLLEKVIELLSPVPGGRYIDNTGGDGWMSRAILKKSSPDGIVLTIDCDSRTNEVREKNLSEFGQRSIRVNSNFEDMARVAEKYELVPVDGVLYDLGMTSRMVDVAEYGASFRYDSPLGMNMDPDAEISAWDIVNTWPEDKLKEMFFAMDVGRFSGRIARGIAAGRQNGDIETTKQLAEIIERAVPRKFHPKRIDVCTKPFLAIRVAVNRERETLEASLRDCRKVLKTGGVLVVICYSSFEDRITRKVIREDPYDWSKLAKKAVTPDDEELERNPRSRSARLRAWRRVS